VTEEAAAVDVRLLAPGEEHLLERVAEGVFDRAVDPILAREFLEDPRHHLVVAIEDGTVVGMASGLHYVHPDKPPELWIDEIAVAPGHRDRGLGRRLLERLFARGRELGCRSAWTLTTRDNLGAVHLFESAGGAGAVSEPLMFEFELDDHREA